MNSSDIMKRADEIVEMSKKSFVRFKHHPPMFHTCYRDGKMTVIFMQELFNDDKGKEAASVFMRAVTKANKDHLAFVLFTVEAWVVKSPIKDIKVVPSQHPDRMEVIQFVLETKDAIFHRMLYIKDNVLTGEEEGWTEMGQSGGRMGSFGLVDKSRGMYG